MSNGCGCEKGVLKYIKPPYAKKFYVPCCMHDDDYDKGGGKQERKVADVNLYMRMLKTAASGSRSPCYVTWLAVIALLYYASVRIFGKYYFNFKDR